MKKAILVLLIIFVSCNTFANSIFISVKQVLQNIPITYSLTQNYTNPFKPITDIKFNISKLSGVMIIVYDIMGCVVETLVNELLSQGTYETKWVGNKYSSGIYFYRLQVGDFVESKRMTLIK